MPFDRESEMSEMMEPVILTPWQHSSLIRDLMRDGYRGLASAILAQGIFDWTHEPTESARRNSQYYHRLWYCDRHEELKAFFASDWGRELLDWCDVDWLTTDMLPEGAILSLPKEVET